MAFAHALYAVVSRTELPAPPKRNIQEIRASKYGELKSKKDIDRAADLLDQLAERIEDYEKQIADLQRRKRSACERAERISDRIIRELEDAALTRCDGFHAGFLTTPSPAAVDVFDEKLLPAQFWREPKPKRAPDKTLIKNALASGERVPGCKLVQGVTLRRS